MTVTALAARGAVEALLATLDTAGDPAALGRFLEATRRLVAGFAEDGPPIFTVGRLASLCHDALLIRAAALADPGGLPPGCCLVVLGSQGRREQFLATDQDNALILDDSLADPAGCARFAGRLAEVLAEAGVPACPRGIMAAAPQWRMGLSAWRSVVDAAAARPDESAVLRVSLLADLRPVAGRAELAEALAGQVRARLAEAPLLVRGLAREAVRFGRSAALLPRLAGRFLGFGGGLVDCKRMAVFPLVIGIKALALDAGLAAVDTLDRLAGLARAGLIGESLAGRLETALATVQSLRLAIQARALAQGRPPDNRLDPGRCDAAGRRGLEAAFRTIGCLGEILNHHFNLELLT